MPSKTLLPKSPVPFPLSAQIELSGVTLAPEWLNSALTANLISDLKLLTLDGFERILSEIHQEIKGKSFEDAIVGMEPTGHYWKALANFLMKQEHIRVVLVNPYHTKKAKELDDNSQTKSDKKDALTIAKLVKDGRYSEVYLPHDIYADLRELTTARDSVNRQKTGLENRILAVMDEFFPEFTKVFKEPLI